MAFGRDVWTIDTNNLILGLKLFYVAESFYLVVLALTKISLLCFFLRVFPNQKLRWATFTTIAMTAASTAILVFMQIFQCIPIRYIWERIKGSFGPHSCLDINTLAYTAAAFSIAEDIIILALPLPILIRLNVNLRTKVGIIFMFSLGLLILITSCVRLRSLVLFARSGNPTWDNTDALIWTSFEVAISLLVTSLPALRIVLNKVVKEVSESRSAGRSWFSKKTNNASQQCAAQDDDDSRSKTLEGQRQEGPHQQVETNISNAANTPRKTKSAKGHGPFNLYAMATGKRGQTHNESEEELELGTRGHGNVTTDIWSENSRQI